MTLLRNTLLKGAALSALLAVGIATHANADYAFSGSGSSGFLDPSTSGEPWHIPAFSGALGWGSPGISYGITPYTQSQAAFGMDIAFTGGGIITPGSIDIGNAAGCAGDTSGGTTFCTISPTNIWIAFQTGPDSVDFRAQNASFDIGGRVLRERLVYWRRTDWLYRGMAYQLLTQRTRTRITAVTWQWPPGVECSSDV